MSPWINYHHLFYFKTIAEERTVSKAAEKLRIGQPTLSAQLKQFEETLGVELFERQHKKLILTEQGKVALDYSKNIFKLGSEMYEVLQDRLKPSKHSLHLASLDSIPKPIVLEVVKQALKIAPCQITLSEGSPDQLTRDLISHKIDIVITNFLPNSLDAKGLFPKLISKKNVSFYGGFKFKHLKKNFPFSISGEPVVLPTYDSKLRFDMDHWAKSNNIELNVIAEGQDISTKKLMAVDQLGLLPTSSHAVSREVDSGELYEIGSIKGVYEELYLVSAQRKIANPIAAKILSSFKI